MDNSAVPIPNYTGTDSPTLIPNYAGGVNPLLVSASVAANSNGPFVGALPAGTAQNLWSGSSGNQSPTSGGNGQPSSSEVMAYIVQSAQAHDIDPNIALKVFSFESGLSPSATGDGNSSFGIPQLHYGSISRSAPNSGLGDEFTQQTGLDARNPANWKQTIDFALSKAKTEGWTPWTDTRNKLGLSNFSGINQGSTDTSFFTDFPIGSVPSQSGAQSTAAPASSVTGKSGGFVGTLPNAVPQNATPDFFHDFSLGPNVAPSSVAATAPAPSVADVVRATESGIPIIGPLFNKANAATAAGLAPVLNQFYSPPNQLQGSTFGQRYQNALALENAREGQFATQHPLMNTAANVGGAVLGTAPLMAAAPAAFGISEAPLAINALASAGTGAAIGGADTAVRSGGDWNAIKYGAGAGALLGGLGPLAGRAIGSGVNAFSNALSQTSPAARNIANALAAAGITPAGAAGELARMGPNATLSDIDPSLVTEASGLARLGGQPTSILKGAMAARAAGANGRIADAVDQYLGPRPDLTATQEGIQQKASQTAAPYYNAARANAAPMDISPVLSYIDSRLPSATGAVADALKTARGYLTQGTAALPGGTALVTKEDPQALLGARQALDDYIERRGGADTTAGKNALREASIVRSQLDGILKQNPNIAAGDAAYSGQMRNLEALQEGTELFKPGTRIEDVQRSLANKSPAEIAAMKQGALSAIHDATDNARQGDFSAARSLFAKSSANRAKLDALFPNSGSLFDTLDGEITMRATEQRVAQNSATAEAQAVQNKYVPRQTNVGGVAAPIIGEAIGGPLGAGALTLGRTLGSHLVNALSANARNSLIKGTARGLAATGPARDQFLGQVERAYRTNALTNAFSGGAGNLANLLTRSAGNVLANKYVPALQNNR